MRLLTYRPNIEAAARLGVLDADLVVDVERIGLKAGIELPATMLGMIDLGPAAVAELSRAPDRFVGAGRNPQEWLWPGDVVEAGVAGIGQIRHPVVAI